MLPKPWQHELARPVAEGAIVLLFASVVGWGAESALIVLLAPVLGGIVGGVRTGGGSGEGAYAGLLIGAAVAVPIVSFGFAAEVQTEPTGEIQPGEEALRLVATLIGVHLTLMGAVGGYIGGWLAGGPPDSGEMSGASQDQSVAGEGADATATPGQPNAVASSDEAGPARARSPSDIGEPSQPAGRPRPIQAGAAVGTALLLLSMLATYYLNPGRVLLPAFIAAALTGGAVAGYRSSPAPERLLGVGVGVGVLLGLVLALVYSVLAVGFDTRVVLGTAILLVITAPGMVLFAAPGSLLGAVIRDMVVSFQEE